MQVLRVCAVLAILLGQLGDGVTEALRPRRLLNVTTSDISSLPANVGVTAVPLVAVNVSSLQLAALTPAETAPAPAPVATPAAAPALSTLVAITPPPATPVLVAPTSDSSAATLLHAAGAPTLSKLRNKDTHFLVFFLCISLCLLVLLCRLCCWPGRRQSLESREEEQPLLVKRVQSRPRTPDDAAALRIALFARSNASHE